MHPLASARAYASLPGRPALVNAVASAFVPFDALCPLVLVDTGAAGNGDRVMTALKGLGGNTGVHTVFNTHYHPAHTGNNDIFAAGGFMMMPEWYTNWLSDWQ